MRCTVVVLVSLVALLTAGVRSAPQRGIDFLPGDEEVQAVVKPIAGDSDIPDQQQQQAPEQDEPFDEGQQRYQPEVPASVDPVENEQQKEDPAQEEIGFPENEENQEEQQTLENENDIYEPDTDYPEDAEPNTTTETDATTQTESDVTTPPPTDANPPKEEPASNASTVNYSPEERLTTDPIVVEEQTSTEAIEERNQFAQDVNTLADNSSNQVRFEPEDNQYQPDQQVRLEPEPTPTVPVQNVPKPSTVGSPVTSLPVSSEYDSKSIESEEEEYQVPLKSRPTVVQSTKGGQFRTLPPWLEATRLPGYDQWQRQSSVPPRSSWSQPPYQTNSFDGFHGHTFHRSAWH
ncbi:uncharacterized protein LOC131281206 [Anopheles ziemanni]|uniref:uncharacterized protein LOC131263462 n=1 Tax=Anopheles coustani TaxID=139045 RepID=UPI0026597029|nr:uncharacterized protein LOC131263462 [Anopheles coustani]XP_058166457.1 uncharacterized protein LOC131281206 [Anopheles ziemanni]